MGIPISLSSLRATTVTAAFALRVKVGGGAGVEGEEDAGVVAGVAAWKP